MSESPDSQTADPIFDKYVDDSESSRNESTTPNSEVSPPESPPSKNAVLDKTVDERAKSRNLAASLSLEEQVSGP
jgi:beta-glucosidase